MFGGFCGPYAWGYPGNFGIGGWLGLAFNLIFGVGLLAGLVWLALWAVRHAQVSGTRGETTAREILQARYAQGEITREQYQAMRVDIG